MFIPLWILMLMIFVIAILTLSTYYLIGFIVLIFLSVSEREMDYFREKCLELKQGDNLTIFEETILDIFLKINNLLDKDKILILLCSWPIIIITLRWTDGIVYELRNKKLSGDRKC